jgi:hypothetical protein
MKMQTIFHLDMSKYSMDEPKAMLEVIGGWLLGNLRERYTIREGYAINRIINFRADPFAARWDIYLTRGKFWRFKLSLEVFRVTEKLFFQVSIGRNLIRRGTSVALGMMVSFVGLSVAFIDPCETFNINIILAVLIGTIIGGFILSLPIRLIIRPYVIRNARKEGIEEGEVRLIEEVKEVLRRAGHTV